MMEAVQVTDDQTDGVPTAGDESVSLAGPIQETHQENAPEGQ